MKKTNWKITNFLLDKIIELSKEAHPGEFAAILYSIDEDSAEIGRAHV